MASTAAVAPPRNLKSQLSSAMTIVWAIALAKLLFHIYFNNRYGYFRDEFDYMSCGDHLQWGYVDQPPLIPFLTHLSRMLLGDSLRAIRFIPALASSLVVVQSAAIARLLIPPKAGMPHVSQGLRDVGSYSIILTAICVAFAPLYLSNGNLLGTNCLEPNLWMGCTWFAILANKRNDPRYWLWFGVVAGIGMEEKYTIAVFGLAIVVSLLLTEQRRAFFNKWTWLGAAAAFLIFLPNLLWNLHYDWPFVQLIRSIRAEGRDVAFGPVEYFFQQMIIIGPLVTPLWVAGLLALLFWRPLKPYRLLGWSYIVSYIVIFLQHGKNYYLGPIYPMLFAAGAVLLQSAIDRTERSQSRWQWAKSTIIYTFVINGICTAPIVVPMLSPEHFLAYAKVLPFKLPVNEYSHARAALPQWFSDQFGWKEIAEEAEVVWNRIPASERADCGIFAQDYGQAGAIDFFGRRHGLPGAISGDRTYWLWGPRGYTGSCLIVLDDRKERLEQLFTQVEYVGSSAHNEWALTTDVPFYIVHGPKFGTLQAVWPKIKRWR